MTKEQKEILSLLHEKFNELPKEPEWNIIGAYNKRYSYPLQPRRKNGFNLAVWDLIPDSHKYELGYGNAGGSLKYRGTNSNIIISPEVKKILNEILDI